MSPKKTLPVAALIAITFLIIQACKKGGDELSTVVSTATAVQTTFGDNINLSSLENYGSQVIPKYITRDNCGVNPVTNAGATLGRVLFYDKSLSVTNTMACSSCHKQELAFGDDVVQSAGVNGPTTRHAMRLANARFAQEVQFFWDKRAATLENQTTQPIQNHNEMGYSGLNGDPGISVLITKLQAIGYYKELFKFVFGDETITEARMQIALAQFIRSIQSFDSKFDEGMAIANNVGQDFPNFTAQENAGKQLFLRPTSPAGVLLTGVGCQACHRAPEFDIDPNSRNNGNIGVAGSTTLVDLTNTRSPSLRNLVNASGKPNGLFMHNGKFTTLAGVIDHYNLIAPNALNTNLDNRLNRGGTGGQALGLSQAQKDALIAFLATLSGKDVYTNKKWANPFLANNL